MKLCVLAGLLVMVESAAWAATTGALLHGDYAGWGYEIAEFGGGDLPLRIHVRAADSHEQGLSVTVDSPAARAFALPGRDVRVDGPRLDFERTDTKGRLWRFALTQVDADLQGRVEIEGVATFRVHMRKAARALASAPEAHPGAEGCYRFADGGLFWIWERPWGELQYFDSRTSRQGTLFQAVDGSLFAGEGDYLPGKSDAEATINAGDAGSVTELVWADQAGPPRRARRVEIVQHQIEAESGDALIRGTLLLPPGTGPHSVAIIVGGSSWVVRSDCVQDARLLLGMGMGVFIYDRRGCGKSTGVELCTFAQSADDTNALAKVLRNHPDVRPDGVGTFGRSRGGWTAPLAAARGEAAFVIMVSGAAISPLRTQESYRLGQMRAAGYGDGALRDAKRYLDLLWATAESDQAWSAYAIERERIMEKGWWKFLGGPDVRDSDVFRWQTLNYRYDPREALTTLRCPLLAIYGERDDNITPGENVPALREATRDAPAGRVTIAVLPDADHGLRAFSEHLSVRNQFHRSAGWVPELARTIRSWLVSRGMLEPDAPNKSE